MMPERYTHEPDTEYTMFVQKAMIDGIRQARAKLAPARLAVGTGYSAANINRRARDTTQGGSGIYQMSAGARKTACYLSRGNLLSPA